jgi:hypothetical protein
MNRTKILAAVIVVLLLATALRFFRIDNQSFWHDEGNSARLSERSLRLIVEGTASDIHPPLYYLMLRSWRELAGDSEFGLRSLSAFLGVGIVALSFALGKILIGPQRFAPIIGSALAAINPALVYYSQEARMYELLAFLSALSTLLLVLLLQARFQKRGVAIAYVLVAAAGVYTHYFFPAVLVAQALVFLIWMMGRDKMSAARSSPVQLGISAWPQSGLRSPKFLVVWLAMLLAIFLLYLPWLPIFIRQAGGRSGTRPPFLEFLVDSARWMTFGPTIKLEMIGPAVAAYIILVFLGLWLGWKRQRSGVFYASTLLLTLAMPVLLMWIVGATEPAFFKFLLVAVPSLCFLAGPGWGWGWSGNGRATDMQSHVKAAFSWSRRLLLLALGAVVFWASGQSLANMYFDPEFSRADYRGIVERIENNGHPNAGVVLNAPNQWEVFTYYHNEDQPGSASVYPLPAGYPDPAIIDEELTKISSHHDRIYALFWGESQRDPQRLVEQWLDSHGFKANDEWISDVRFVTYAIPAEPPGIMASETTIQFGDSIVLEGFTLGGDNLSPGQIIELSLFWQATQHIENRYKIFLHLIDENGNIVTQRDSEPGGGLVLTSTWQPGQTVVDNHGLMLPFEARPGTYTILLGMYDVADPNARLQVVTEQSSDNAVPLVKIAIQP